MQLNILYNKIKHRAIQQQKMSFGGGLVVSVLLFYYDHPVFNPTEVYSFLYKNVLEKRPGLAD